MCVLQKEGEGLINKKHNKEMEERREGEGG